ncbi:MAG: rRNA maturation RNase YbeY [Elusimicrobiota bacterium]|nr:rRNA maturation RNase YbeY [Elusimicrobiota bacterium]
MKSKNSIVFVNFPKQIAKMLKKAVLLALKVEKIRKYQINFILISDEEIKKLNSRYRKVKRITDVISFLVSEDLFLGDVYISKNRSQKQSLKYFQNDWQKELCYLAIHGTLHLCGYSDYDPENKEKMFAKQDYIFQCLFSHI